MSDIMVRIGRHVSKLTGYAPALPTPFTVEGDIDISAFEQMCDLQLTRGATALIVCGTTGEAPTLTPEEHRLLIQIAATQTRGRIPVIAGAGANATAHAIELTRDAEVAGADAILSVVPYYNRPMQAGLYAHFQAIAESTGLPIILYDVPARTGCCLSDHTVARLAELPRIIGLKDAAGDATRPARLRPLVGANFRLLCGEDGLALPYLAQGGDGCISVTSNVAPGLCRSMFWAWKQGHSVHARRLERPISELTAALFHETNPAPLKQALAFLGLMSPAVRLPLVGLSEPHRIELSELLFRLCHEHGDQMISSVRTAPVDRRVAVG